MKSGKELLKDLLRPFYYFVWNSYKACIRGIVKLTYNEADFKNIPIVINNYNRLSYPLLLINQLEKWGYNNIYILDNHSTFPPLLEYYKRTKHKVIFLNENLGYKALWNSQFFKKIKFGYYVYTDPDVLPLDSCGENFLKEMLFQLNKFPHIEKIGLALSIHDLPDYYALKNKVIEWEKKHWEIAVAENIYDAPVDTTFALYKPLAKGNAEECPAYRIAGSYGAKHLPWYEDSLMLTEEEVFYQNSITKKSSYWINLNKNNNK